jgi:protein required for attachment to host cells
MASWILVANSSYAEIYSLKGRELHRIEQIDFPEGRLKGSEIYSDRPGRGFESTGSGTRHALTSQIDAHGHEQQVFAHKLADYLRKAKAEKSFEKLIIISPPEFLGELRRTLNDDVKKVIEKEFKKEISSGLSQFERQEHIYKLLDIQHGATISPWEVK